MHRLAIPLILLATALSLSAKDAELFKPTSTRDIAYSDSEHPRHKLDVYAPIDAPGKRAVVVFVHGGGWQMGDKKQHYFVGHTFAKLGYVCVLPNYRLYPEVTFPSFVEDAAEAVKWVRENISDHGGDPDQIFLMGHSAGGHLVSMISAHEKYLGFEKGTRPEWLRGVMPIAGVYAWKPASAPRYARPFGKAGNDTNVCMAIGGTNGDEPPFLLIHGMKDKVVPVPESTRYELALKAQKIEVETAFYKDLDHMTIIAQLGSNRSKKLDVLERITAFIEKHRKSSE